MFLGTHILSWYDVLDVLVFGDVWSLQLLGLGLLLDTSDVMRLRFHCVFLQPGLGSNRHSCTHLVFLCISKLRIMRVTVRCFTGQTVTLDVEPNWTLTQVLELVFQRVAPDVVTSNFEEQLWMRCRRLGLGAPRVVTEADPGSGPEPDAEQSPGPVPRSGDTQVTESPPSTPRDSVDPEDAAVATLQPPGHPRPYETMPLPFPKRSRLDPRAMVPATPRMFRPHTQTNLDGDTAGHTAPDDPPEQEVADVHGCQEHQDALAYDEARLDHEAQEQEAAEAHEEELFLDHESERHAFESFQENMVAQILADPPPDCLDAMGEADVNKIFRLATKLFIEQYPHTREMFTSSSTSTSSPSPSSSTSDTPWTIDSGPLQYGFPWKTGP